MSFLLDFFKRKHALGLEDAIAGTRFKWKEALLQRKTGTYAKPTDEQRDNIEKQAKALDPIHDLLGGFTITSWLRTPEYNKAIGGAPASAHLDGLATDFVPSVCTVKQAREKIKKFGGYPGRLELDSTTWVHADQKGTIDFYANPANKPKEETK